MKYLRKQTPCPQERLKSLNNLIWIKEDYNPPNQNYQCTTYAFWVRGERVARIEGPSIGIPSFRIRGGKRLFGTLLEAKVYLISKLRSDLHSQIKRLQEQLDALHEYRMEEK